MYKDVGRAGKRILAVVLSLCMILGLTDFSVLTVRAEGGAVEITAADIKYNPGIAFEYNGEGQKPDISIVKDGNTLQPDSDYSLNWSGIDTTNASDSAKKVPITGGNNIDYSWPNNLYAEYWILPRDLEEYKNSITIEVKPQKFQEHQPMGEAGVVPEVDDVIVTDTGILTGQGGKELTGKPEGAVTSYDGLDYTYSCENNTTTGTARIKFTGHNNYTGTIFSTFTIRNNEFGTEAFIDDIDPQDQEYEAKESYKPELSVYTNASDKDGTALTLYDDYEVTYNEAVYPETNIIKPGTYTAVITGRGSYEGSVVEKSYKVVKDISKYPDDITVSYNGEAGIPDQPYTGKQIVLDGLKVYDKGVLLKENEDYYLTYNTNVNAGKGSVLVRGKAGSCYKGSKWFHFNIIAGDLSAANDVTISVDECVYTGSEQTPDVTVTFNNTKMEKGRDYKVTYADNINAGDTASVTITGRPKADGGTGNLTGSKKVSFTISPKSLSTPTGDMAAGISVSGPDSYDYDGDKKVPVVAVTYTLNGTPITLKLGTDYTITPASSTAADKVPITIEGKGNYTGKITRDFVINAADIEALYHQGKVTVSGITDGQEFTYIGTEIKPTVTVKRGEKSLTSADYTLSYTGNTNVGTAKVVITGQKNYTGTIEIPFKIVQKDIGDTAIKYTPQKSDETYNYTFEKIEPAVKLEYQPSTVRHLLKENDDYTVEYSENVNRGTATITIKGKGNYTGTRTEHFKIAPLDLSDSEFQINMPETFYPCDINRVTGDIEPVDPTDASKYPTSPTLIYKDKFIVPSAAYEFEVSQNTAPGKGILKISAKEESTNNFTGSRTENFNIKGDLNDAVIKINNPKKVYTGEPITLGKEDITVTYNGQELTLGTDYVLESYSNNTEVSTDDTKAQVTVKAADNSNYYTSSDIQESFEIVKKNLNDKSVGTTEDAIRLQVAAISDQEYTGSSIEPELTVTYNGTLLEKDTDYVVVENSTEHENNINAGDAYITIEGTGVHFTGTREIPFTITKRDISKGTITIAGLNTERIYSGEAITLGDTLDVTYTKDSLILNNEKLEYSVTYRDNDKVGEATVIITGTGKNFTGEAKQKFCIKGNLERYADNTQIEVTAKKTYTGQEQTLSADDIKVTYFGQELSYGNDYEIYHPENHTDASENVAFTVKAKGDYFVGQKDGGQDTENGTDVFSIAQKDISDITDTQIMVKGIKEEGYTYTGEEQHPEDETDFAVTYTPEADQEITLVKGDSVVAGDYTVAVQNAVNVVDLEDETITDQQKPALVITATEGGNYTGTRVVPFKINPQSLNDIRTTAKYQVTDENLDGIAVNDSLRIPFWGSRVFLENLVVSFNNKPLTASTENGEEIEENDYTLSYRDNDKVGKAYLVIEGHGNYCDTIEIPFWITGDLSAGEENLHRYNIEVDSIEPQPYTMGNGAKPKVTITYYGIELKETTDGTDGDYKLSYANNKNVAQKDSENPPTVTIEGINGFEGTAREETFEIVVRDLSTNPEDMEVRGLNEDGYAYTGSEICPSPLELYNNGELVAPDQYTISYGNNINGADKNSENPPYVRISGKYDATTGTGGNYTGYMDVPFTIIGIPIDETNGNITVEKVEDQIYTGKAIEPKVVVKHKTADETIVTLKENKDYKLSYMNNTEVGIGSTNLPAIRIEGINNFSGERIVSFKIRPRNMKEHEEEFTVTVSDMDYTGAPVTPSTSQIQVKNKDNVILEEDKDYRVSKVSNNLNAGTEAKVEIAGIGNYTGKLTGTFTIKPKSLADTDVTVTDVTDKVFNSKAQTQTPVVSWGDIKLSASDYSLSYSDNVNAGTAVMTVTGVGNYTGTKKVSFKIAPYTMKEEDGAVTVANIPEQVYTEAGVRPEPVITYRDAAQGINYQLVYNKDYTLTYKGNNVIGKDAATVTVVGKGNFSGSLQKKFTVRDNVALAAVGQISAQTYTGKAVIPKPNVVKAGKALEEDKDYTLAYKNNIEEGKATITIMGMGEYRGTKEVTFDIVRDISKELSVKGLSDSYIYTGNSITPSLGSVSIADKTLKKNTDYKVTFSNNKNVGTATVVISGIGYYTGSKSYPFEIKTRNIAQCKVAAISDKTYDGKSKKPEVKITYGNVTLKAGTDYNLVYMNNIQPGRASVIVSGKGNYNGNKLVGFDIELDGIKGLKASALSTSKIKLSWTKKSNVTGYQIADKNNKIVAKIKGSSRTSYTISDLKAGNTYYYKVRSYLIKGGKTYYSDFSTLVKAAPKPTTPKISVSTPKAKQALVSWKKVSGASGYEIYRKTKTGSYRKVATTSKASYTNTKLTSGSTYYFKIRAYKNVNGKKIYSGYSNSKYVIIK